MRIIAAVFVVSVFMAIIAGSALAVPVGKTIKFEGGGTGKVVFTGKMHADKGVTCNDCHPKIFQMKKGKAKITMGRILAGTFCGECHNGIKAFKPESHNCARCHNK